jgi:uncharacterized protein
MNGHATPPRRLRRAIALAALVFLANLGMAAHPAGAAEVIPPAPEHYFNDNAGVVSADVADQLNRQLEQFEKDTSNQILVVIYPKMQSDSDIADYTVRVAQAWRVGQKAKSNGAVLFVFVQDRKLFIQVGYGLEGALPDATCKEIIDQEITPSFKTGNYEQGLRNGINAIIAATKGEYKGNGSTVNQGHGGGASWIGVLLFFLVCFIVLRLLSRIGGTVYGNRRQPLGFLGGMFLGGFGGGGGGSSGGGGFSGGGGGFSGGGGSFGGGGAGGSW